MVAAVLIAGCSSHREPDWAALVGTLTYDQALLELGPPSHAASLTDGTKVAEWLQFSSRVYSTPGVALGGWGGYGMVGAASVSSTPNVYLLLTFGPDGRLAAQRRIYR